MLAHNLNELKIDPKTIDFVVISHRHGDHTNGLLHLLKVRPDITIYAPGDEAFGGPTPRAFFEKGVKELPAHMRYFDGKPPSDVPHGTAWRNAKIVQVRQTKEITKGIHLVTTVSQVKGTLEMPELTLALSSPKGLVLITGCGHTGVEKIVEEASGIDRSIHLLTGGFHLLTQSERGIEQVAVNLREKWKVQTIAPGHCTGEQAFLVLRKRFGDQYLYAGIGESFPFPSSQVTRPWGQAENAWDEDIVYKRQLEANGEVAFSDHVAIWYPAGSLTKDEANKLVDELSRGIIAAKKFIGRPKWNYKSDGRIYYYLPDARFISHAPGGNCAFIPLWRMKERKSPWLHESLHLLLKSDKGDWLRGESKVADRRMPLWLHEGLADAIAIDVSQAEGLVYFSPLIDVPVDQLDALAARTLRQAPSAEILDAIGGRGKPQGLFGPQREKFAIPFYNGSASFVRYIAKRHGYKPLLSAIDDYDHENETLERVTGETIKSMKEEWLKQIK